MSRVDLRAWLREDEFNKTANQFSRAVSSDQLDPTEEQSRLIFDRSLLRYDSIRYSFSKTVACTSSITLFKYLVDLHSQT